MECDKMQTLLHPYLDGELDLMTSLTVEEHLRTCAACALSHQNDLVLRTGFRDGSLYTALPASLSARLQSSPRPAFRLLPRQVWSLAAALALVALLGWSILHFQTGPSAAPLLAQEVVASHVRSLMGAHLADVASTNQHTVKPWFNGKLDYSPPVTDLADDGFPLVGGRLDYLNDRPVAALVYRHAKHLINLFVWPIKAGEEESTRETETTKQGYHVVHWEAAGMTYWSVSDLNPSDLDRFVVLIQQKQAPEGLSKR